MFLYKLCVVVRGVEEQLINIVVVCCINATEDLQCITQSQGERQDYLQSCAVCDCDGLCV